MGVIFDEVVADIEPVTRAENTASAVETDSSNTPAIGNDQDLARRINNLQERAQRLMAD